MKTCTAILIALGVAMAASAQDIDRFRYFQEHGVMDPQISAEAANSLVREGIASEEPGNHRQHHPRPRKSRAGTCP